MTYETKEYTIYYNECDSVYIKRLVFYFEKEKKKIFDFFEIKSLDKKLVIKLYDNLDKYIEYRNGNLAESSVGNMDVDDNNYYIHILSYKEFVKRKGHMNQTLTNFYKLLMHEFVHVCHEQTGKYHDSLIWVKEGIAIFLSNQYDGYTENMDHCNLQNLLNDNRTWYINYYTLIKHAYCMNGISYLKMLSLNPSFALDQTPLIYKNCMNKFQK